MVRIWCLVKYSSALIDVSGLANLDRTINSMIFIVSCLTVLLIFISWIISVNCPSVTCHLVDYKVDKQNMRMQVFSLTN